MPSPLLRLTEVSKRYESPTGAEAVSVLRDISMEIGRAESVAVVGPSGSGKSTLLNIIGTLDRPTSGQVLLDGQDLSRLDDVQLATVRNREIGIIFQAHHLLPQCTVLENVLVPTLAKTGRAGSPRPVEGGAAGTPRSTETAEQRAKRLLAKVGLDARLTHRPGQLSGGERQRVAVVRALINQPKLLLADEPTGALDRASARNLAELLVRLNQEEGVTLIVVTHALDLAKRMGRVLELRDGRLASENGK
ncbi:MAG: ABC transporter [Verrucomicrobia bacterium]|nr:MAG: ABC transporter [Verrucomicrobiota bacterium]